MRILLKINPIKYFAVIVWKPCTKLIVTMHINSSKFHTSEPCCNNIWYKNCCKKLSNVVFPFGKRLFKHIRMWGLKREAIMLNWIRNPRSNPRIVKPVQGSFPSWQYWWWMRMSSIRFISLFFEKEFLLYPGTYRNDQSIWTTTNWTSFSEKDE